MTTCGQPNRTVLVTGASSGIGAAVARHAAKAGWRVLVGYGAGRDRAEAVAAQIETSAGAAIPVHLPLDDVPGIERAIDTLLETDARPQALVLCASPPLDVGAFTKATAEAFRQQFNVAVVGNHALIAKLWKTCFRPRRDGHIVAVLTAALGPPPTPQLAPYLVAKAALKTLLDCARAEYGRGGLRVSFVSPGYTDTPMLDAFNDRFLELAREASSGKRFLRPDDVAASIVEALANPPVPGEVAEIGL